MEYFSLKIPNAQGTPEQIQGPSGVPTGGLGIGGSGTNLIQVVINLLFVVGIILAIIFIIYSGIQWAISGGDKQKLQNARNRLTYSIVGLIVVAAAFIIINFIIMLLGGSPKFFLNTP